jgi:hypothetical protein
MSTLNRRLFLKFAAAACAPRLTERRATRRQGKNLAGWEVVLGDALYAAPGEPPVTPADIDTIHTPRYSELRANIQDRRIMAHNITFYRLIAAVLLHTSHRCGYQFRLPDTTTGETLEGGLFVWDGSGTRLDYGTAFQWVVNPANPLYGAIQTWSNGWQHAGTLTPNTHWHSMQIAFNPHFKRATIVIDLTRYTVPLVGTPRPPDWGTETAARLQAEIVSLYPGEEGNGALHTGHFRNWYWKTDLY